MRLVYRTILQLIIISRVIALNFENIINSLPTNIPENFKKAMLEMFSKHAEDFTVPQKAGVNINNKKSIVNVNQKGSGSLTNTAFLPKTITKVNKLVSLTNKPMIKIATPKKYQNKIMRSGNTNTEGKTLPNEGVTTPKPVQEKDHTSAPLPIPPPGMAIPMPMPMPIPYFARVPVMVPMRSYFEPVIHDHPPLYIIKKMIERDEKNCMKHKHSKESVSETDTSSEYINVGKEYYDDFMHIQGNRDQGIVK